jgi:hypothetical protein
MGDQFRRRFRELKLCTHFLDLRSSLFQLAVRAMAFCISSTFAMFVQKFIEQDRVPRAITPCLADRSSAFRCGNAPAQAQKSASVISQSLVWDLSRLP